MTRAAGAVAAVAAGAGVMARMTRELLFFEKRNQKTFASWHPRPKSAWAAQTKE
jgi:hypothetical protein